MFGYPYRKTFIIPVEFRFFGIPLVMNLKIQQATISQLEYLQSNDTFLLELLGDWGVPFFMRRQLLESEKLKDIMADTFFYQRDIKTIPSKEKEQLEYPGSSTLVGISQKIMTPIRELQDFTIDEIMYALQGSQYLNLDEEQKEDLLIEQRAKKADEKFANIDRNFQKKFEEWADEKHSKGVLEVQKTI